MMKFLKTIFSIEKKPKKGLLPLEWIVMIYLIITLLATLLLSSKLPHADQMIWGRVRIVVITAALWLVYRLLPCRFTRFVRITTQMGFLAWWYPDTYELNRILPNLDHIFAQWEQQLFGYQPALVFAEHWPSPIVSELFDMGYAAYFPMIAVVGCYYFGWRYNEFERCTFILMASFLIYYVIFIIVPVVGPTFYYKAVGVKKIAAGIFPSMHDYFNYHQECLPSPGYTDGVFYQLVEDAKSTGERPTAAFPSSHIGISTIMMWLIVHARQWKLLLVLLPLYLFLCCATVYIQAHYLIDAIAGFITGTLFYFVLLYATRSMKSR
ncbi:MAG: phosphatase PAP2 family protein [Prevotella sp.]|nr:phosphatase PAP2 family protein [Prevotella sp.]